MDVTHDAGGSSAMPQQPGYPQTAEDLRRDIRATSQVMRGHVAQLEEYVQERFGSFDNPFHVRERVASRPLLACGLALTVGVLFGASRASRAVPRLAGEGVRRSFGLVFSGVGRTLGTEVVAALFRKP